MLIDDSEHACEGRHKKGNEFDLSLQWRTESETSKDQQLLYRTTSCVTFWGK